jgi:hypothetical protein
VRSVSHELVGFAARDHFRRACTQLTPVRPTWVLQGLLPATTTRLLAAAASELSWRRLEPDVGPVRQSGEVARIDLNEAPVILRQLGAEFADAARPALLAIDDSAISHTWLNELTALRYTLGQGISAHRDHATYMHLVVLCNITGKGRFRVVSDRRMSETLADYTLDPGDVLLMGAPGISSPPMHTVTTLSEHRLSVSFRHRSAGTLGGQ